MIQHKLNLVELSKEAGLQTLVENRTAYTLERCELNVFETYSESYKVPLVFNDFVITSMLIRRLVGLNGSAVSSSKLEAMPTTRASLSSGMPALASSRRDALARSADNSQLL